MCLGYKIRDDGEHFVGSSNVANSARCCDLCVEMMLRDEIDIGW